MEQRSTAAAPAIKGSRGDGLTLMFHASMDIVNISIVENIK